MTAVVPGDATGDLGRLRPPLTKERLAVRLAVAVLVLGTLWGWRHIGMSFGGLLTGAGDMGNLLGRMLPPRFTDLGQTVDLAFVTLWMAVIGTVVAVIVSAPLAFLAARNTSPYPWAVRAARAVITLTRAVPDVLIAMILVRAIGIGVLPGVLALGIHSIGMIGKLFADAIEQIDEVPRDALDSTGAGRIQSIVTSVVPQVLPSFIAAALYRLDINLRSSAVLGLVGGGGIGFLLQSKLRGLDYDEALGIVIVMFVFISLMELISGSIRSRLLGRTTTVRSNTRPQRLGISTFDRERVTPPWTRGRVATHAAGLAFLAVLVVAFWQTDLGPGELLTAGDDIWSVLTRMFPPDFTTARAGIVEGMVESVAVAFVATALGTLLAFPLGLLAARNVTTRRLVSIPARLFLVGVRGIPELIVAVLFVSAMGLGPVPGTLALTIGTAGFFAKLIADAVEEVPEPPREAVFATGAGRSQELTVSVIPAAAPALFGNLLYVLDVNLRTSTILGIVAGGGIGFLLMNSLRVMELRTTGAIVITIFAVVYVIELLAGWVRKQVM